MISSMRGHRRWFIAIGTLTTSACLINLDGLSGGPSVPGGNDSGAFDAGPDAESDDANKDATVDASPPPGVVVFSESFEAAGPTMCAPYSSFQGSAHAGTPAHQGDRACLVCRVQSGTGGFTLDGINVPTPKAGEHYAAEAWFRAPDGVSSAPSVFLNLRVYDDAGEEVMQTSPETRIDDTWRRASVDWTLPFDAPRLNSYAGAVAPPDACFLVDDFVIRRLP